MMFVGYLETKKKLVITDKEKMTITKGIIDALFTIMKDITTNQTPKKLARKWVGVHSQSKTNISRDTTLFNVLIGKQKLPALPRQFRINLDDEEKNIRRWDLKKGILEFMVNNHILVNKAGMFDGHRTRGRPIKSLEFETRGRRDSYYDRSVMKEMIDEILSDPDAIREIDESILKSPILYEFIEYSWETGLHEAKASESAFRNSYKPAIRKYGIKSAEKGDKSYTLVKNLSEHKLRALARAHAIDTIQKYKEYDRSIIYAVSGLVYLING